MHHKRKRHKNARAGCLMCKPHKANGIKGSDSAQTLQEQRAIEKDKMICEDKVYGNNPWSYHHDLQL